MHIVNMDKVTRYGLVHNTLSVDCEDAAIKEAEGYLRKSFLRYGFIVNPINMIKVKLDGYREYKTNVAGVFYYVTITRISEGKVA